MGLLDELRKMTRPYDEEDFFDDEPEDGGEPTIVASKPERQERSEWSARPERAERTGKTERRNPFADADVSEFEERATPKKDSQVVNIHTTTAVQVVVSRPERFDQVGEIANHLKEKRTVVMNLETTSKEVSRRLVDFLSGVAFANGGKIKKVAINTYIITPYNVDLMGDIIDELENNGVYI